MEEKNTKKARAEVCLDRTGVSGLPFHMFLKLSCLFVFSSLVEHISAEWSHSVKFLNVFQSFVEPIGRLEQFRRLGTLDLSGAPIF